MTREYYKTLEDALESRSNVYFPAFMGEKVRDVLERAVDRDSVIDASEFFWKYIPTIGHSYAIRLCKDYRKSENRNKYVKMLVDKLRGYYDDSLLISADAGPADILEIEEKTLRLEIG